MSLSIVDYLVRIFGNSSGRRENRPMTEKVAIAARLGEQDILLPGLLSQALQANDRIKLRFTLLQEAIAQARNPRQDPFSYALDRRQAVLNDPQFDSTI